MISTAKWIGCGSAESPLIRKRFFCAGPKKGSIQITGLGLFRLYLNGQAVSEGMTPCQSDYRSRTLKRLTYPLHDHFTHRIYYLEYDLTPCLKEGENLLEIHLGNGWYRQTERNAEGDMAFAEELTACFAGEVEDNLGVHAFSSDGTEEWRPSFVTYSQLFIGEVQDSRPPAVPWQQVSLLPPPDGVLQLQTCPIDRIVRHIQPTLLWRRGEVCVYDMGENASAVPFITTRGRVRLTYAEELQADQTLDPCSTGMEQRGRTRPQLQEDVFIAHGERRTFTPQFLWHAFRYCQVEGPHEEISFGVLHSDVAVTSAFSSSSRELNFLYQAYVRTQLANMHLGVPSDCPHRERVGYTGDGQICCESAMLLLDSRAFYRKWIRDILDCQDLLTGHVQHSAPFMGGGGGPCGWGGAIVEVPYRYWRQYGEMDLLPECFAAMEKWLEYLRAHSENGLVTREEEGGWCLGDWASLTDETAPAPFVNTCLLVDFLEKMAKIAQALGKDPQPFLCEASVRRAAIRASFYDVKTGSYCGGMFAADAFALHAGLRDDPRTGENLIRRYRCLGYADCGFVGMPLLIEQLFRLGAGGVAVAVLTGDKPGGFGYMARQGATTLWEYPDGRSSHNHPALGACTRTLFHSLLGIAQREESCGFAALRLSPVTPENLSFVQGSVTIPSGRLSLSWRREAERIHFNVDTPQEAEFHYAPLSCILPAGTSEFFVETASLTASMHGKCR